MPSKQSSFLSPLTRNWYKFSIGVVAGLVIGGAIGASYAIYDLWARLPDVNVLNEYRPPLPLRIYAKDGKLLAEYGEERRELVPIQGIPEKLRLALLSIEDADFYEHGGVDLAGIARAALVNLASGERSQGASTITMQVARTFFLNRTKSYGRKISEILLAYKLEQTFSKDKILELYMNQVYLGERAYGFAAAASVYFGKSLQDLSTAEAAMLAGLPKGPSIYNPVANLERATIRQQYILRRMRELGHIDEQEYRQAAAEPVHIAAQGPAVDPDSAYVAELARGLMVDRFGQQAYAMGLDVVTTIGSTEQRAATHALQDGLIHVQAGYGYSGPQAQLGAAFDVNDKLAMSKALSAFHAIGGMQVAVIRQASAHAGIDAVSRDGNAIKIPVSHMPAQARRELSAAGPTALGRGAIIWVEATGPQHTWSLVQPPEMEGALVSLDAESGDIVALAGGFDFHRNNFDHATQARRQPGSTFKPFVYSAALEQGLFPNTRINDEQRVVVPARYGQPAWEPKNSPARYDGFITEREGLAQSKNVVAVNVMEAAGESHVREHVARFGFDMDQGAEGLTLALGAKPATPLEMARAYSVFANGGKLVYPRLVTRVSQRGGQVIFDQLAQELQAPRVTSERNAFVMNSMLQSVVSSGSGHRAANLGRPDVAAKTGTSNEAKDAWFAGYSSSLTTIAWVGFDLPKSLGRVSGATVALPIWLDYMQTAVAHRPFHVRPMPPDLTRLAGDFVYPEFLQGRCIAPPEYVDTPLRCGTDVAAWQPKVGVGVSETVAGLAEQREEIAKLFSQ